MPVRAERPPQMTLEEGRSAIAFARSVLASADDHPAELVVLARLVELLITRGKRMGEVYAAALGYARANRDNGGRGDHHAWLALRGVCLKALELEDADAREEHERREAALASGRPSGMEPA